MNNTQPSLPLRVIVDGEGNYCYCAASRGAWLELAFNVSPLQLQFVLGEYELFCTLDGSPDDLQNYRDHAHIVDDLHDKDRGGGYASSCAITVAKNGEKPFLLIRHTYLSNAGFFPGILYIPETNLLFVGADEYVSAYRLDKPKKLWQETTQLGFWKWQRHGEFVLMAAELQLAAWDIYGWKKWSTFVEPPWEYTINKGMVQLDVMGRQSAFPLDIGPLEFEE